MADLEKTFWDRAKGFSKRVIAFRPFTKRMRTDITFGKKGMLGFSVGDIIGNDPLKIMRPGATKKISPAKALSKISGWSYAAIKAIADEISCIEFRVFKIKKDGTHEEQFEHDLLDLLEAGNPTQTGPEIRWTIAAHLESCGNAYGLLQGVESENDIPTAIFLLNPACVSLDLDKTTFPYVLKGYKYEYDNRKYYYKPYEILHMKVPDPNDPFEGIGTMQSIAEWIDNDNFITEFQRQFFVNGANMEGVFETEYTTEEQIIALKIGWESNHQGVENTHKTGILPKGVKWKATQASMKDMDMGNISDKTRDKILAGFKVSKTVLGTAESDTNRATAETADYVFAKRTIKPKMQLICSYLNEFLAHRYGDDIYISFKDPTPEDKAFLNEEMKSMVGNQPVLSLNEARERYVGVEPVDGGDVVKISNNMQDIDAVPAPKPEVNKPEPKKSLSTPERKINLPKATIKTRAAMNFKARKKMNDVMSEKLISKLKELQGKKWNEMTKEEYYSVWKSFTERVDKIQPEVIKALEGINKKQKKEVVAVLPDIFGTKGIVNKAMPNLFDYKKWVGITVDVMTPIMTELYKSEGQIAAAAFGKPGIDITENENAKNALDLAIELLSQSYNQTTLDSLKEKLGESLALNEGLDKATELVSSIYEFANTTRASTVAVTETFRVANEAQKQGWIQSGVVKTLKWVAFDDDLTCQFCYEVDGKVVEVEGNFFDNGDSVKGSDGGVLSIDYADVGAPPLHPNCRCGTQPEELVE